MQMSSEIKQILPSPSPSSRILSCSFAWQDYVVHIRDFACNYNYSCRLLLCNASVEISDDRCLASGYVARYIDDDIQIMMH